MTEKRPDLAPTDGPPPSSFASTTPLPSVLEIDEGWDGLAPPATGEPPREGDSKPTELSRKPQKVGHDSASPNVQTNGGRKGRSQDKLGAKAARKAKKAAARKAERKAAEEALRKAAETRARAMRERKPAPKPSPAGSAKGRTPPASVAGSPTEAKGALAKPPTVVFGAALAAAVLAVVIWWMWMRR